MFNPLAAIVAKQSKMASRFRNANATNPARAMDPIILGLSRGPVFTRLVAKRILIEASPNLFYLDEVRAQIHTTGRRTIALIFWAVILVVLVAYLYLTK